MRMLTYLKTYTALILLCYTALFGVTLAHVFNMAAHGMPQGEHCIFSFDELSLCAQQVASNLTLPTIRSSTTEVLLAAALILFVFFYCVWFVRTLFRKRRSNEVLAVPLYRLLFSEGILHPKAP